MPKLSQEPKSSTEKTSGVACLSIALGILLLYFRTRRKTYSMKVMRVVDLDIMYYSIDRRTKIKEEMRRLSSIHEVYE